MFGAILKATNSSFQKGMTFCPSIYVKKVMKLLASYLNSPRMSKPEFGTKFSTVLLAISDSDVMFCLQSYWGITCVLTLSSGHLI